MRIGDILIIKVFSHCFLHISWHVEHIILEFQLPQLKHGAVADIVHLSKLEQWRLVWILTLYQTNLPGGMCCSSAGQIWPVEQPIHHHPVLLSAWGELKSFPRVQSRWSSCSARHEMLSCLIHLALVADKSLTAKIKSEVYLQPSLYTYHDLSCCIKAIH